MACGDSSLALTELLPYRNGVAVFVAFLSLFLAGVAWGLRAGFGDALFAPEGSSARVPDPGSLKRTFVAALLTGCGGSGALLTRAARWGAEANLGCALFTGILFAALVTIATKIVLDEKERLTSP